MNKNHDKRILRAFGRTVKKLRLKCDFSQQELGEKAGLHRTYIGSIERCERNVSLVNIEKIAEALGVSIETLIVDGKNDGHLNGHKK